MCDEECAALRTRVTALERIVSLVVADLKQQGRRSVDYPRLTAAQRKRVIARDRSACRYCGRRLGRRDVTVDHVHPRSRGGSNDLMNLVVACRPCQDAKADRTLDEVGMELLPAPGELRRVV